MVHLILIKQGALVANERKAAGAFDDQVYTGHKGTEALMGSSQKNKNILQKIEHFFLLRRRGLLSVCVVPVRFPR